MKWTGDEMDMQRNGHATMWHATKCLATKTGTIHCRIEVIFTRNTRIEFVVVYCNTY